MSKLAGRHIRPFEVEEVFWNGAAYKRNAEGNAGDWLMIGFTNRDRPLTIVVRVLDETHELRPITGWPARDSEIDYFKRKRK